MSVTFNHICELLESLEKVSAHRSPHPTKKVQEKSKKIITNWFAQHRKALDDRGTNGAAILSIIFPHWRKDRVYNLKSAGLSRKITSLLNLNHGNQALLNSWTSRHHGDFGACFETVAKRWDGTFRHKTPTPVEQVERLLTQLAAKCKFSSPATRQLWDKDINVDRLFKNVLIKLESWEAKWLVRLILGNYCTVEFDEDFVLEQFHFLLPDLLKFQNDFNKAFELLRGELSCYPANPDPSLQESILSEVAQKLRPIVGVKIGRPTFHKAWSFDNCFKMIGKQPWAAEVKYDGEYCEIHINLEKSPNDIQIFSKNGKDATQDRRAIHKTIREALSIGAPDCLFKRECIVLGEMVVYSEKEDKILEFSKIRKHISRSGRYLNNAQDSLPHPWEHLMIVFFDILLLDNDPVMRLGLQERRNILRELVKSTPGKAMRARWCLIDPKLPDGLYHLKEMFALSLANREEGLVLKPLHAPYLPILSGPGRRFPAYYIKLKKDYLADMGGERDLGDFAVIGASYDAQVAAQSDIKPIHYTHFHLGCLINMGAVHQLKEKRKFKAVGTISIHKCIPKTDAQWLNERGPFVAVDLTKGEEFSKFEILPFRGDGPRMEVAFKKPFIVEVLGGGFEKAPNEKFYMLRHPRVQKIHHDRTWEDAVMMEDLERMSKERWAPPNADNLDGHAREVAMLVSKYKREFSTQESDMSYHTTQRTEEVTPGPSQKTTQRTEESTQDSKDNQQESPDSTQDTIRPEENRRSSDQDSFYTHITQRSEIPESIQTQSSVTTTGFSQFTSSTRANGIRASFTMQFLIREDTAERLTRDTDVFSPLLTPPESSPEDSETGTKKRKGGEVISPPKLKRLRVRSPLREKGGNGEDEGVAFVSVPDGVEIGV